MRTQNRVERPVCQSNKLVSFIFLEAPTLLLFPVAMLTSSPLVGGTSVVTGSTCVML